jgi:uncharacterized protein YggE
MASHTNEEQRSQDGADKKQTGRECSAGQWCVSAPCGGCRAYWWGIGAAVFICVAVWSVAKGVETKRMLSYPPAGVEVRTITLSVSGKAQVVPDTAEVELSVLTEGKTPKDVQQENTRKMNAVMDFIKANHIDQKDIKTATYSLYPKYEYVKG